MAAHPITVVGLGPGGRADLTVTAARALASGQAVRLRTRRHPMVAELEAERGAPFDAYDAWYDAAEEFDALYRRIVDDLVALSDQGPLVYAVPGHPLVAEATVRDLLARPGVEVRIVPGLSGLEAIYGATNLDPTLGLQVLDALRLEGVVINPALSTVVLQLYQRRVASVAKIQLMRYYPDEHPVRLVTAAGVPGLERVQELPLYRIDHEDVALDHLTSLVLPPAPLVGVPRLVQVVDRLRGPGGCPWDQDQTHASLTPFLIEEAHEAVDAILRDEEGDMVEELGDVLLQVVLHARIAEEREAFDLDEIAEELSDKLIRRHPHVFGSTEVSGSEEVLVNWAAIKAEEKGPPASRLGSWVPMGGLGTVQKLIKRARKAGFVWPDSSGAWRKVEEEQAELREALALASPSAIEAELGDLILALGAWAQEQGLDPIAATDAACARFARRFAAMEAQAEAEGQPFEEASVEAKLAWWAQAKRQEFKA